MTNTTATTSPPTSKPTDLPPQYDPVSVESEMRKRWDEARAWHADPDDPGEPFSIVIPPPNVTAALHLGHALNNTLQDVLIRHQRMRGRNAMWMPGTDHAGIATQTVVDKRLQAEGQPALKEHKQMEAQVGGGREKFIEKVQDWKDEYEKRITDQLKEMGCSCDWDRQRFTMDDQCATAVREAFFQLFKDGLIYRGKRLVNWDPVTQTALADDEVEMEEVDGHFWYMKYPVVEKRHEGTKARRHEGGGEEADQATGRPALAGPGRGDDYVTVATTRPETMLGDTAVAVNPNDPHRAHLIGKHVRLPIVNRVIPIIGDDYVTMPDPDSNDTRAQYASGFLKVTPAHDPNDYEIGGRHDLPVINVMAPDASISVDHDWPENDRDDADPFLNDLLGLDRDEARKRIVEWFDKQNLLGQTKPYRHSVGHSYRSHVPVEPYLSDQWYVKVTDDRLAGAAVRALETPESPPRCGSGVGFLQFHPQRYAKGYQDWHENIRDWCISRQLWWGHRIPVWSKERHEGGGGGGEESDGATERRSDEVAELENDSAVVITETETATHVCLRHDDQQVARRLEAAGFTQDPDVLDTWFSSALWPMSTLGWPNETEELRTWNPTSVLCTAREIITLWVSRMVMFNLYFRGELPFYHVFIHAMIQDGHGQKMSKSLGNGVDPMDIIHSHGADAMRFTLASMTTHTQDVRMPVDCVDPHTPHPGERFSPKTITTAQGHVVAAPIQERHGKNMVSSFGYASGQAAPTDEMPLARNTSSKFDMGGRFANKMWNAVRFALSNLTQATNSTPRDSHPSAFDLPSRWILSRLARTIQSTDQALRDYEFANYTQTLYDFFWRDLCDWYIEAVKPTVSENAAQRTMLAACIDASLRLLHPAMPFITERLWIGMRETGESRDIEGLNLPDSDMLITTAWPTLESETELIDDEAEEDFEMVRQVVTAVREVRSTHNIPPKRKLETSIRASEPTAKQLLELREVIETLSNTTLLEAGGDIERPADAAAAPPLGEIEIYLHGLTDPEQERKRLTKRRDELAKQLDTLRKRLGNDKYVENAPADLVQQSRDQLAAAEHEAEQLEAQLAVLEN